ncbi:alpha/beta fold hydrolase [Mannheimia sp. AT1]|uniref:Alpha/beta fold hydrolase n=1 Tax=Mannheimia cairinae TaxID=3025936 RepID=A0ABT5MRD4_9PAST|nr:alpha/beta fold hydrolase [Mannheimia cairinae]MDD0824748.1 alpha/beta fold hydrolase [Mannheimia cairinae]MDD0826323.1 alpha/beta fold hydrolase [Mannheimia cairinae]
MTKASQLNFLYQPAINNPNAKTMVFLHGLFGDLNNLGVIAKAFAENYAILPVDLRNHGRSFQSEKMTYDEMATDLKNLLIELNIQNAIVVGHSMGGKSAMALAHLAPDLVEKLVVIDIAPVNYTQNRHRQIIAGLFAVKEAKPATRQKAKEVMATYIPEEGIQQFMLKSFDAESEQSFRFNLTALHQNYQNLMNWKAVKVDKPTLFIKGALSDYIVAEHTQTILEQFPQAKSFIVANADHWVHAEKPDAVIRAITKFLEN